MLRLHVTDYMYLHNVRTTKHMGPGLMLGAETLKYVQYKHRTGCAIRLEMVCKCAMHTCCNYANLVTVVIEPSLFLSLLTTSYNTRENGQVFASRWMSVCPFVGDGAGFRKVTSGPSSSLLFTPPSPSPPAPPPPPPHTYPT